MTGAWEHIFIENNLARDNKLASGGDIDDSARRLLRRPKVDTKETAVGEVLVPLAARQGYKHADKAAKSAKIGDRGGPPSTSRRS